jgi:tRNA A-37 threonylcarbamoyl transferase component Bud32
MSVFTSLKQYCIVPKYGNNFAEYKLTPKTRYHLAIRITEELQKLHSAGFTHNNVTLSSIVLDGDNIRLSGFGKA